MSVVLNASYFELFGLPVAFRLDTQALAERYRELQRSAHPDRFAAAADRERRLAVQQAAHINEAYHTLRDPRRRARYLLGLHGVALDDERDTTRDPEFLMEQMALREQLEDARTQPDPFAALADLNRTLDTGVQALVGRLEALFEAPDAATLAEAKLNVHRLQFFERLREEAAQLEEMLADSL